MRASVKPNQGAGRKAYEAPRMFDAGAFLQSTGFLGRIVKESLGVLPSRLW
jgi:hypothetical protein